MALTGEGPQQPQRRQFLWDVLARMTLLDRLLTAGAALLVGLSFRVWRRSSRRGERVEVEQEGRVTFAAPLADARQVKLTGPLGETLLEIRDGQARILTSPCPDKLCVRSGAIHADGELLACVPNRVVVRVIGQPREDGYDLLSR